MCCAARYKYFHNFYNLNYSVVPTEPKTYTMLYYIQRVTWWCSWLRHCSTSRKVAGSIPDGVLGIIFIHIILGSTESLTEMSTRKISCGVKAAGALG